MSGKGCRNYENFLQLNEETWFDFLNRVCQYHINFPRIDLAIDDRKPYLSIPDLIVRTKEGLLSTKLREIDFHDSGELKEEVFQSKGGSLYLGSSASNLRLVFYEKGYEQNKKYPEQKIYGTSAGIHVRSKSESMIVYLLHDYKIPFRYESELELGQVTVYPDFTIRHPKTGKLFLWEHLGMMGDPTYRRNALSKLQLFMEHGWIPSVNLILTFETKEYPLDMAYVEGLIKDYFVK